MPFKHWIQRTVTKYRIRWNGNAFFSRNFDKEMLFIMTPGRSGSTLLRRYLMENFYVHIPPESSAIIPVCAQEFALRFGHRDHETLLRRVLARVSSFEFRHWNLGEDELIDFLNKKLDVHGKLGLDDLIYGFYDLHREKFNPDAILLGDKTPYLVYYLDMIPRIFKQAKYIFLIRHPFAVVASRMNRFSESVESALNRWLSAIRSIEKSAPFRTGSGFVLRYEDLIEDPQRMLQMVGDSLELKPRVVKRHFDDEVLGDIMLAHHIHSRSNIISDRNNALTKKLRDADLKLIAQRTKRYLQLFNYEDSSY